MAWIQEDVDRFWRLYGVEENIGEIVYLPGWKDGNEGTYSDSVAFTLGGVISYPPPPGFEFELAEGIRYIRGNAAAVGGTGGGNVIRAIERYEAQLREEYGYYVSEAPDILDYAPIWLTPDYTYTINASSNPSVVITLLDPQGWQIEAGIRTLSIDDIPAEGWYYLLFTGTDESYSIQTVRLTTFAEPIAIFEPEPEPYIRLADEYNWDNDIDTGDGYYYVPAEYAQVYRTYLGAMGRLPDASGFNWWRDQIENGTHTLESMAEGFIHSPEFINYADSNGDGELANYEIVHYMYEGVFGREADNEGYSYWMNRIVDGSITEAGVLVEMTQSNEYINQTLDTVADYLFT